MNNDSSSTPRQRPSKRAAKCKMVTYGGFFIMAGPAPKGVKPVRCPLTPLANGFCEKHNPEHW